MTENLHLNLSNLFYGPFDHRHISIIIEQTVKMKYLSQFESQQTRQTESIK